LLIDFIPTESKENFLNSITSNGLLPKTDSKLKAFEVLCPNDRKTLYLVAAKTKKELSAIFNCSASTINPLATELSPLKNDFLFATQNFGTIFKKEGRFKKGGWIEKETYKIKPCNANSGMKELWLSNLCYGKFKNDEEIQHFLTSQ
jgi:hypothetical protein